MRRLRAMPGRLKAASTGAMLVLLLFTSPSANAQPQPPKDFVAVDETAPGEQIPAIPLVATAYGFIWVVLLGYVWTLGRRLRKVEGELAELESRRPPFAKATGGEK